MLGICRWNASYICPEGYEKFYGAKFLVYKWNQNILLVNEMFSFKMFHNT